MATVLEVLEKRMRSSVTKILLLLALLGTLAGSCHPVRIFPALLSSDPANGSIDVPRTAWPLLSFASAVAAAARRRLSLSCDGAPRSFQLTALSPAEWVVNPDGELPAGASCSLSFPTATSTVVVSFQTAASGLPASILYDRTNLRETAPYPDDFFLVEDPSTVTQVRVNVPVPVAPTGVQIILQSLLFETNRIDGFSPIGHTVIALSGAPDPASLPLTPAASLDPLGSVALFDIDPASPSYAERLPFRLDARSDITSAGLTAELMLLFPSQPLNPQGRYGLVVTRRAQLDAGRPLDASAFMAAALATPQAGEAPEISAVRNLVDEVMAVAENDLSVPIPRDDVALALRISVRSMDTVPDDLLQIKQQILDAPLPGFQILSVDAPNPALPGNQDVAAIVSGTWDAPDWRGVFPSTPGGFGLARDPNGDPLIMRSRAVPFTLALPTAALSGPAPIILYQHGNPGSSEVEVPSQARRSLAAQGFAVLGITDILNREVAPGPGTADELITQQVINIFGLLLGTGQLPDHWLETHAEMLAFLRFVQQGLGGLDVLPIGAPDGIPELAVDEPLSYFGISEGANNGPGFLAYAPEVKAAALVVGGSRLAETLIHQQAQTFLDMIPNFAAMFQTLTPVDIWVGLSFFQADFDRQDNHNHARFLYRNPVSVLGTTQKASILLTEGLDDSQVPNHATDSLAWQLGPIPHLTPVQRAVPFLNPVDGPVQANIDAQTTAAFYQFVPIGVAGIAPTPGCLANNQAEGHFCAQTAAEAFAQREAWFLSALVGVPVAEDPLAP